MNLMIRLCQSLFFILAGISRNAQIWSEEEALGHWLLETFFFAD